jgi:hypothetical protein
MLQLQKIIKINETEDETFVDLSSKKLEKYFAHGSTKQRKHRLYIIVWKWSAIVCQTWQNYFGLSVIQMECRMVDVGLHLAVIVV